MIGFPVTLPIEGGKARRWSICQPYAQMAHEDQAAIVLMIEVSAAEAANTLRHLTRDLGKPAHADFPGVDETAPPAAPGTLATLRPAILALQALVTEAALADGLNSIHQMRACRIANRALADLASLAEQEARHAAASA